MADLGLNLEVAKVLDAPFMERKKLQGHALCYLLPTRLPMRWKIRIQPLSHCLLAMGVQKKCLWPNF